MTSRTRRNQAWLSSVKATDIEFAASAAGDFVNGSRRNLNVSADDDDNEDDHLAAVEEENEKDSRDEGGDEKKKDGDNDEEKLVEEEAGVVTSTIAEEAAASFAATQSTTSTKRGGYDPGVSMGLHVAKTNVFTMETLSPRFVSILMIVYYTIFVACAAADFLGRYDADLEFSSQFAILPSDATSGDELLCYPTGTSNGTCIPDSVIDVDEANLLANTVVVSNGLNLSDWVGEGALPGTPSFTAHNISQGSFLADDSILDYDSNPELHHVWDDIAGAFWIGYDGALLENTVGAFRSVIVDLVFIRPDGTPWPEDMAKIEDFVVDVHAYACTRSVHDCQSIGEWRNQFIQDEEDPYQLHAMETVQGNVYKARIAIPNTMLLEDVVESIGWRFVVSADPYGAVTDCAVGNHCIVEAHLFEVDNRDIAKASIQLAILIVYVPFFGWWIYKVTRRLGNHPKNWHVEHQWVLILGVGYLMYNGFFYVSLQTNLLRPDSVFLEKLWAAAYLLTMLGQTLQLFALACFCDAPRRYVVSRWQFYRLKVAYCIVLCTAMFVVTMYHFPDASGRDEPGSDLVIGGLGFVTAPETWPRNDKIVLTTFQILWILCLLFGMGYYFITSRITARVLADLPYNMTRPLQLSFRFFKWVTLLWIIVEFFGLLVNIAVIITRSSEFEAFTHRGGLDAAVVALNQLHIFASHQSPGKILFGFVFAVCYEFFFLPPSSENSIRKTHHVTEDESKEKTPEELSTGRSLLVLDRARMLCTCSRETYLPFNDEERKLFAKVTQEQLDDIMRKSATHSQEPGVDEAPNTLNSSLPSADALNSDNTETPTFTPSNSVAPDASGPGLEREDSWFPSLTSVNNKGAPSPENFGRLAGDSLCVGGPAPPGSSWAMGCRLLKRLSEPDHADVHNTRALILRHEPTNDLIISFRGTKTPKQIKTDLMTQKITVSLDTFLTIPSTRGKTKHTIKGIIPEDLEKMMSEGTGGKVKILDLLHKEGELPEFLEGRTKAQNGIRGTAFLHFGFWSSYSRLRKQVHSAIYEELVSNPGRLLVCGHSLGGAQATACAYDMSRWIIPSVKKTLLLEQGRIAADKVSMCCYTYGSPRLGGLSFQQAFDKAVPETERIINDGDVVTMTPPKWLGFVHVGDENVFDYTGSCSRNPSLIEKKFAHKTRTNANAHRLPNYTRAIKRAYHPVMEMDKLLGLIEAAYGKNIADIEDFDMWKSVH